MVFRAILAAWRQNEEPTARRSYEGEFSPERLKQLNEAGYNVYFLPNGPSLYDSTKQVDGSQIDTFRYVFVDCDLKDGVYQTKEAFLLNLKENGLIPTLVTDSGRGIHAYWEVSDLDAISYLRLQRRLCRFYKTDPAVSQICQLMRYPGYDNPKEKGNPKPCTIIEESDNVYTCEQLDKALPGITQEDEQHCQRHYQLTYNPESAMTVNAKLPPKFGKLVKENKEVAEIWTGNVNDRSKGDYRLAHIMLASGFTKDEALSVLVNASKALSRAPIHRVGYAEGIVSKIWPDPVEDSGGNAANLSSSVRDILVRAKGPLAGERLTCYTYVDDTVAGFRRGQVLGLVAGSGVGKTAMALNLFMGFVKFNPDLDHFFVPLEQSDREIAARWQTMCGDNEALYDKVHVMSNYDNSGIFRDLSLVAIKEHILKFIKDTGRQVGCVVIDHIGVLCNENKLGQDEGVKHISKAMKGFAMETDTFLIMQSQTAREKAGTGDLELNKDAAFGTSAFENYCDYLVTLWQPLKRMYSQGAPTVMSYKFCKVRHKNQKKDIIQEDRPYSVFFDPDTQLIRELTQAEADSLPFWVGQATNKRKEDRKTDVVTYESIRWENA